MITLVASLLLSQSSPWKAPQTFLTSPINVEEYRQQFEKDSQNVRVDGDLLSIMCKWDGDNLSVYNSIGVQLKKVPGTDFWIGQARLANWNRVFFNYTIADTNKKIVTKVFYGASADKPLERAKTLTGKVETFKLPIKAAREERDVTVYLPPNPKPGLPAVYMTDGGVVNQYAKVIEPLILAGKIRPVALIGVANGGYTGDLSKGYEMEKDNRALEYLKVTGSSRYRVHLDFFCDDVVTWAEAKFGLSSRREDRAVHGFSNGGAFVATATADRPEVFAYAMPYSVAAFDRPALTEAVRNKKLPKYYICAGKLEVFIRGSSEARDIIRRAGGVAAWESYDSGHDSTMWEIALMKNLQKIFPGRQH